MKSAYRERLERAFTGVHEQWIEAPWFVILMIAITAFVGPGLVWAIWKAVTSLL